ncbi:hypothetical protein LIER_37093 [Lithospermum erythrorhizon]|uniref:Uncharacterized protein n=1 Tax=Lithospermum erythrorhizon TaxID=34254 RepID=A0AAV3PHW6_LITER
MAISKNKQLFSSSSHVVPVSRSELSSSSKNQRKSVGKSISGGLKKLFVCLKKDDDDEPTKVCSRILDNYPSFNYYTDMGTEERKEVLDSAIAHCKRTSS